ncbi:RluA family pseudouridine synthase [Mesomycoplasma lagogenitalium]|uniref:Pseudouridine synthase n=1 Tax=Mesomycoplasma lagogenitalium TaxID=171286 RepID=A0ABY8LWG3_9BACT|nr:RluA family pseudouridine synthase [Mesomycoplasma lagogenitalium]WGI36898.1 RluA family pseudouridine synthase [Mesomycoplasma lagogenitalium]
MNKTLVIEVKYKERIDKYISDNSDISRNDAKDLILNKNVIINDSIIVNKPKFIVSENQVISIKEIPFKVTDIIPEKIDLKIVYEDSDLIVIDKPSGMVVHPAPGNLKGTLVNGLLYHFQKNLSDVNGQMRPGILHRIDKDTSGLLIVAKNNKAHTFLAQQLKDHLIKRKYKAIVEGFVQNEITHIDLPIGRDPMNRQKMSVIKQNSKNAITHVYLEKHFNYNDKPYSLIRCELETGRTHQIRVHMAYIKHPVFGDPLYDKKVDEFNQRLHAYEIEFTHPNGQNLKFTTELPKEFEISN